MRYAFYIIIAGCLWGIISIFINILNAAGFDSMQCVALRTVFTALILLVYLLVSDRSKLKIRLKDIPFFIGTGIFSIVLFNYCYFESIELIGGSTVPALLLYTAPIFVMIMSAIFFRERITKKKILALILTFAGLGFVTGAFTGGSEIPVKALILGLGSGFGYALYSIFGKFLVDKYDAMTITFYTFVVAAAGAVPLSGVGAQIGLLAAPNTLLVAAGLALLSTVLPFLLYTKGLACVEAGRASVLATVEPFVAEIVGAVFFREQFTVSKIVGMLLIIGAILYLNMGNSTKIETKSL